MKNYFIDPTAQVKTAQIGAGTTIWQFCVILEGATIGENVNVCSHCFIENQVVIGNQVTIKSGVQLWNGITLGDHVFVGPNVTFSNDKFPRSKVRSEKLLTTTVGKNASLGAGAVILPGLTIGENAMVGAGAVVTHSVPPYAIVAGNPAKIVGYAGTGQSVHAQQGPQAESPNLAHKQMVSLAVKNASLHYLSSASDIRGDLSFAEFPQNIPFRPQRYFVVYHVPSAKTRGEHAHRQCEQFLTCVHGSCSVVLDDSKSRVEVLLDAPNVGVYIPPMVWGIQYKYSADAVLVVFASHPYEASDYIRDYGEYLQIVTSALPR